jgi:PKD repeat protein
MLLAVCVGCKRVEVDFSYEPTAPRAGQSIAFTNLCTEGEEWLWTFGDNSTSLAKNPYKIYKKPGTYMVRLMVDSAKHKTCAKMITVYDTVPTFVCDIDSILHYQNVTFKANVYNPFNQPLTYQWTVSESCKVLSQSLTDNNLVVYFKNPTEQETVQLVITQNGKEFAITKHFTVHLTQAPAIVMRRSDGSVVRQRMINDRIENYKPAVDEDYTLLNQANDTSVTFNGKTFYASQLDTEIAGFAGMEITHVQLDAMAQKWYIVTPEGLFVANFSGTNLQLIDADATGALCVDAYRNLLYWATPDGLKAMPLVKSKNNLFSTQPILYNHLSAIDYVVVNNDLL